MKKFFSLIILGLICPTICIVKVMNFEQNCDIFLVQASRANSPELALEKLNIAIAYIEANTLTEGYTFSKDKDVGFWYQNIIAYRNTVKLCLNGENPERNYFLIKGRGNIPDAPLGISLHPHSNLWTILNIISICLILCGIFSPYNEWVSVDLRHGFPVSYFL